MTDKITVPKPTPEAERLKKLMDAVNEAVAVAKIIEDYMNKNPQALVLKELDK